MQKAVVSNKAPEAVAERAHADDDAGVARGGRAGGLARLRAGARRRRNAAGTAAVAEQVATSSEDEGDGGGAERAGAEAVEGERGGAQPAVSGKVAREERRQEKERQKEALREQQLQKVSVAACADLQLDACSRLRQTQEERAAARAAADAAEAAEFEKWRDQIGVESGGTAAEELASESQGLLAAFVEHVKARKLVVLEELAAEFGLRTAEAVSRVQALESMGRLTGVMDDRGKFIYISPDEMATVAAFINAQGRVSIAELANRSNDFIRLAEAK